MTKNKIKEVALKLFSSRGYEETSLSMIAKEVGIKTPSIYAFYKSKEDLFLIIAKEVFLHHFNYIKSVSEKAEKEKTETKLFMILQEMYAYHLKEVEKTSFYRRYMWFPPEGLEHAIQVEFNRADALLVEILEDIFSGAITKDEVKEIELASLVNSYLCLMDGLFTQLFYYPQNDLSLLEKRLNMNWRIYWEGIKR